VAYPVTYFDSTTDEASATPIMLAGGGREEADINLHAVPELRIKVDTPRKANGSIARAELRQTVFGTEVGAVSSGFLDAMQSGSTEFNGVAPGHYELEQGDPPRDVELDATANQEVDPSLGAATTSVSGTLRSVSGAAITECSGVTLEPADLSQHRTPVQTPCLRGAFRFGAVPSGEWQMNIDGTSSQSLVTSIASAGRKHGGNSLTVQDRPLAIVVTVAQSAAQITGFARRNGKGVSGVMIELVPHDGSSISSVGRRDQSDSDGSFALNDVLPGRYTIIAVQDGWNLDWADAQAMARYLPGGIPVTITDRSEKIIRLPDPVPVQNR
jgi:hypothetical protein